MKGCLGGLIFFGIGMVIVGAAFLIGRAWGTKPEDDKKITIDHLTQSLKDSSEDARKLAAEALGEQGEKAASAIPELIEGLKDSSEDVRKAAAEALEKIGPKAKEALPALKESLKDGASAVREAAENAIERLKKSGDKSKGPVAPPVEPDSKVENNVPPDADHEKNNE